MAATGPAIDDRMEHTASAIRDRIEHRKRPSTGAMNRSADDGGTIAFHAMSFAD